MKRIALIINLCISLSSYSQMAFDSHFINSRFHVNCSSNILRQKYVNFIGWQKESQTLRTYAMDEPQYWISRRFFKLDFKKNKCITEFNKEDRIIPFLKLVKDELKNENLIPYVTTNFSDSHPYELFEKIDFSNLEVILKVDFYFNYETLELNNSIIGVHLMLDSTLLANIYYPQLKLSLKKYNVKVGDNLMSYADFFDNWRFFAQHTNEPLPKPSSVCGNCSPLFEQQSEFDALIMNFLIRKEINKYKDSYGQSETYLLNSINEEAVKVKIDTVGTSVHVKGKVEGKEILYFTLTENKIQGKYVEKWLSGKIKENGEFENGKRKGKWISFYSNGCIKAERNYDKGVLNGRQKVYYSNGNIFLEYDMHSGEYNGIHHTYYSSGQPIQIGQMNKGYVTGDWNYYVFVSDNLKKYLQSHERWYPDLALAVKDNKIEYKVSHIWNNESEPCLLYRECHKFEIIGDIK